MRPNRRMPGTQRPAKQEPPVNDHRESPAFMRGEEVKPSSAFVASWSAGACVTVLPS